MPNFENIEGNKISNIFRQLIKQRILVKVFLRKCDFENLTLVTAAQDDGKVQTFRIDAPKGLHAAIAEAETTILSFEFTSTDHVAHRFDAEIDAVSRNDVSLRYPSFIQRRQQRDNFRVKVPSDSHAVVTIEDTQIRMEIENISLGGLYCYCPNRHKQLLSPETELSDMELSFMLKCDCCTIQIQRVQVKRTEPKHRPRHFGVAFEFIQIKRNAKKQLVQQIYELQRVFLQNRLNTMT